MENFHIVNHIFVSIGEIVFVRRWEESRLNGGKRETDRVRNEWETAREAILSRVSQASGPMEGMDAKAAARSEWKQWLRKARDLETAYSMVRLWSLTKAASR